MSDMPDNLLLERLREIRALLGEVREDTADTRLRVGMLEAGYASISLRLDRLAGDVERIKRRLDLVEMPRHRPPGDDD
jgi:chromosome segregation ATPase